MPVDIPGANQVIAWFGKWPSFHDAEILEVHLDRKGLSRVKIHTWNTTDKVDGQGYYVMDKHAVVTFALEDISELELNGFSSQNVIGGLDVDRTNEGYRLSFHPCYGLTGTLEAKKVSVELKPGKPV